MTLKTKLVLTGMILTAVPLITLACFVLYENEQLKSASTGESIRQAYSDLDHVLQGIYGAMLTRDEMTARGNADSGSPSKAGALRESILKTRIGSSGYVYVIDSRGTYLISKDGKRDGEVLWEAKDADGSLFIQKVIATAKGLRPGDVGEIRYPWKNAEDPVARMKLVRLMYYQPWDWVVGVGSYEDEFFVVRDTISSMSRKVAWFLGILGASMLAAAGVIWFVMAGRLAGRIGSIAQQLRGGSEQVAAAARDVAGGSQSMAQGASEQSSSLEETSAALEELSSMTKQNADNALTADQLMKDTGSLVQMGAAQMEMMSTTIDRIKESAKQTANIIKTIDEIAFQTNLLALNAAVEAARAGEAGKGFAVVAEEVRNLAHRSADAAKETSRLIEESQANAAEGVSVTSEATKSFTSVLESVSKAGGLVSEIAGASKEQAVGLEQINKAVAEMDKVVQQNAASTEESAAASEELSSQAQELDSLVEQLIQVVEGGSGENRSERDNQVARPVRQKKE